jgi:Cyclic nucleotide-binding domain
VPPPLQFGGHIESRERFWPCRTSIMSVSSRFRSSAMPRSNAWQHWQRYAYSKDGQTIFQAGQRGVPFYVVESGGIAIVDESRAEPTTLVIHGPREFTGDVSLLTDRPAVISAYATGACRAYCVSQAELRRVIQEVPDLSDKLLEAFQTRRTMLERSGFIGVRLFGHLSDPDVTVIREFFDKNKVPHTWSDADEAEGRAALQSLGVGPDQLPFCRLQSGHAVAAADGHPAGRVPWPEASDSHRAIRPGHCRSRSCRTRGGRLRCLRRAGHDRP